MPYEVQIREVGPQTIMSIRAVVPTLEMVKFFDDACNEMRAYVTQIGGRIVGPAMSLWQSEPGLIKDGFDIETCLPVEHPVPSIGRMRCSELPAGVHVFTVHHGPYDDMSNAFDAVWKWIQENDYEMAGPPRDVVLEGPKDTNDPTAYRTEIVFPISARK